MAETCERPPSAKGGPGSLDCLAAIDRENSQKQAATQPQRPRGLAPVECAKRELIRDDLDANISAMQASLDCALVMLGAGDDCGLLYSLRRARAYWRAIGGSANELASLGKESGN